MQKQKRCIQHILYPFSSRFWILMVLLLFNSSVGSLSSLRAEDSFPPVIVRGDSLVLSHNPSKRWFLAGIVDNTPSGGMQLTNYDHDEMESQLIAMKNMKATAIRWNAFLKGLDLMWDEDGYVSGFYPEGDPIQAVIDALNAAKENDMLIYIVLSTAHFLRYGWGGADNIIAGRIANKDRVDNNLLMFSTEEGTQAYIDNIIKPMAQAIGEHPALLGYLLINEAYGMTDPLDTPKGSWSDEYVRLIDLQRWVNRVAGAVKTIQPGVLCSVSGLPQTKSQYEDAALIAAGGDTLGILDFWQYNYYPTNHGTDNSPFHNSLWELTNDWGGSNKPAICGEFPIGGLEETSKNPVARTLSEAYDALWDNGFSGGFTWQFSDYYKMNEQEKLDLASVYNAFYTKHLALESLVIHGGEGKNAIDIDLQQNFPNPFNPTTTISYTLNQPGNVTLKIYNCLGQLVQTLVNDYKIANTYTVKWNSKNESGNKVPAGIYFYRLETESALKIKKMVLTK